MRFVYFDECKYQKGIQPYYWLGAISICSEKVAEVESRVNDLAERYFGTTELSRHTEFHAKDLFHRKNHFREWKDTAARIECLESLAAIVGDNELMRRIHVKIDPALMVREHGWEDDAFMYLTERIQRDSTHLKEKSIMIGDLDGEFSERSVVNLSRYRSEGTDYLFGVKIDRLIDSVYFIPSHHSRLLQLADIYTYCLQLYYSSEPDNYPRKRLKDFIANKTNLLSCSRYKHWPTSQSWLATAAA